MRLPPFKLALGAIVLGTAVLAVAVPGCFSSSADDGGSQTGVQPTSSCVLDASAPPPMAPNGYYTSGATVCAADGNAHQFHGVDRPSFEFSPQGVLISSADFQAMAGWGANVVRVALNQDYWLANAALYDSQYATRVQTAVGWAESAGLDVILDLHWSDCGDLTVSDTQSQGCGESNQQRMADLNSLEFWKEVATVFKGDGHVLFELYNEPHNISWDVWLNGGSAGNYTAVGMQQLYDTIRHDAGADNVVIAGGLSYAYDLSQIGPSATFINGYNIMYATHPYSASGDTPSGWASAFGHIQTSDFAPVIATEFGDNHSTCTGAWDSQVIAYMDQIHGSWTAWAWYEGGCSFPSLISDWSYTPTVQGIAVRQALLGYAGQTPSPSPDAGVDATTGADGGAAGPDAGGGDATTLAEAAAADGGANEGSADAGLDAGTVADGGSPATGDAATNGLDGGEFVADDSGDAAPDDDVASADDGSADAPIDAGGDDAGGD